MVLPLFIGIVSLLIVVIFGLLAFSGKDSYIKRILAHIVNFFLFFISVFFNTELSFIGRKEQVGKEVEILKWYRWILITIFLGGGVIIIILLLSS